jgi:hypothetical protein
MSCTWIAARSRGTGHRDLELARQEREFRMVGRPLPDQLGIGRGSATSSAAAPAKWSAVTLRMQLPAGLDGVHLDLGQLFRMSGMSFSAGQLYWMFWRVVKWP